MRVPFLFLFAALSATGAVAGRGDWGNKDDNGPPPPPPPPLGPPPPPPNGPPPPGPPGQPRSWGGWPQAPVQLHPNGNWWKCLQVRDSWFQNGQPVDIFDCNGTPGQNWVLNPGSTKVQVAGQNFCLDAGVSPYDGTKMKIWACYNNLPAQQFWYTDDKRIALSGSGKCLDLTNGGTWNGNVVQLWQCLNWNTNQIWN